MVEQQLEQLNGWDKFPEIAIDGMSGTGKSTFIRSLALKFQELKVNNVNPRITTGSRYNVDPIYGMEYLSTPLCVTATQALWDRCVFSNLIYYYVHHLMYCFKDQLIPDDESKIWPIFNNLASATCLIDTVRFVFGVKKTPTIFIVCSDLDVVSEALVARGLNTGEVNDIWNADFYNYQMAQLMAYKWFAKLLGFPCFDINDFFEEGYNIGEFHVALFSKINRSDVVAHTFCVQPNLDACDRYHAKADKYGPTQMLHEFSNK